MLNQNLLFGIAAFCLIAIWVGLLKSKVEKSGYFLLLTFSALGMAYLNFLYFNFNQWKTFSMLPTALFWAFPGLMVVLVSPKNRRTASSLVLFYLVLCFVVIDYLPDFSDWIENYFVDKRFAGLVYWAGLLVILYPSLALFGRFLFSMFTLADSPSQWLYLPYEPFRKETAWYILLLPIIIMLVSTYAQNPEFINTYPFYKASDAVNYNLTKAISWEVVYALSFIALEFFFRGFIIHSLKPLIGWLAVPAMAFFYCLLHFGKPMPECIGSLLGGLMLGTVSYQTGSIWGGLLCHLSLALGMDLWVLLQL
jgi:hypothetical protein